METAIRYVSRLVLSVALFFSVAMLCGPTAHAAGDPKLATKFGIDSTHFSLSVDPKEKAVAGKTFHATIHISPGPTWHVWSASMSADGGLTPLRIHVPEAISKYFEITSFKEVGKIIAGYDSNFETATKAHMGPYDIIVTMKVRDNADAPVPFSLYVFYQTCNETMCMPPRTFEVPMELLGAKPIMLKIEHGTPDNSKPSASEPLIESSDKSSLIIDSDEWMASADSDHQIPWRRE